MKAAPGVSVVIATLGEGSLFKTIEILNSGSVVPTEILVCIPEVESVRVEQLFVENVRIIRTPFRGQVAQRAYGFQQVKYEFVLQLDDDISVRETCLENLVACMNGFDDVAVGPKLFDVATGAYCSFLMPSAGGGSWFQRLLFWVINGARGYEPGRIGRAGISMGVPEEPGNWSDLGWLPGGCVLHRKKNLVLYDFYPFKGKAFVEDLFHSVILRKNKIRLMRCGDAACDVDFSSGVMRDVGGLFRLYRAYARALRKLLDETGGSRFYLYMYLILYVSRLVVRKMLCTDKAV